MKKKLMALLLCGLMGVTTLAGCGGGSSSGSSDAAGTTETAEGGEAEAADAGDAAAQAIADRKASGDMPTVVMAFMNFVGPPAGMDRIAADISAITEEELGVKFELQIMDSASYAQNMKLMLSSGEQVDLFNVVSIGFMPCVNNGYLYDLNEDNLLQTYGQGILETFREDELAGTVVGDALYGIPVKKDDAAGQFGISIPVEYLDAIGFDYASMYENEDDEIIYTDIETIDGILAKLHEQYPDKTTFYMDKSSIVSQCLVIDAVGGDNFGVLNDPMNSLEVTDLFSGEQYMNLCRQMYKWNQAGYISKDAVTETNATTTQIKAGSLCAYKTATKPGIRQQESNLCGTPVIIFQIGPDFKKSTAYNTMPWAINSQTADPVAAMQVLNLCYTDERVAKLLCWGEEGKEYVYTEDGHLTFADGVDASNSEYFQNVNWQMPNQFIAGAWEGDPLDIWENMQEFNDNAQATKAMGFTWDNSEYSAEYTALVNVYNEYQAQLELGFVDPDVAVPEMLEKLKAAGLDTYMAAKQEALNAWAAENGIQ